MMDRDPFFAYRMYKMQRTGVQHHAGRLFGTWQQPTAIQITAQNRVAQSLAVDAKLMSAPGFRGQLYPRHWQEATLVQLTIETFNDPIAGAGGLAVDSANRHQREQGRIFGDGCVYYPFIVVQMSAEQGTVYFGHSTLAELVAKGNIHCLIARNDHQPGSAEIQPVGQGAAGGDLYQPVMNRIPILRIFTRETEQPGGFVNDQQMIILIEVLDGVMARRSNKGIDNRRHQANQKKSGGQIITSFEPTGESDHCPANTQHIQRLLLRG